MAMKADLPALTGTDGHDLLLSEGHVTEDHTRTRKALEGYPRCYQCLITSEERDLEEDQDDNIHFLSYS